MWAATRPRRLPPPARWRDAAPARAHLARQAAALALVLLGCGALAACLGPTYRRPELPTPAKWREGVAAAVWPGPQWWHSFKAPELDALIAAAQAANFDLAAALARVDEADAQARIAGAPLLPSAQVDPQGLRTRIVSPETVPPYELYNEFAVPVSISYELDFWGKNRSAHAAAEQAALASRFDRQVVALTIVTAVAQTYFQVVALRQRVTVARQNLANAQQVLDGLLLERRWGTATELDVTQQRTVVATARAAVPPLEEALSQALDALAILVAKPPEAIAVTGTMLDAIRVPEVSAGLPSQLLARRPDVREAEAQLIASNYDIQNARAQFFPDFTLTAEGGVASKTLASLFETQSAIFTLGAEAVQPLFTGGRLTGQVQYARSRYRELLADYRKTAISAYSDVEDSLAAVRRTREEVAEQAAAAASASAAFHMAQIQFRVGTVTLLTMLNTETTYFTAEDNLVQARLAQLQAAVALYKALGGGWSGEPDATSLTQPQALTRP